MTEPKTLLRALALQGVEHVLTVTNRAYFFQTRDAYAQVRAQQAGAWQADWLLEPVGRNTGPALAATTTNRGQTRMALT